MQLFYEHIAKHLHFVGGQIDYYEDDGELGSCAEGIRVAY